MNDTRHRLRDLIHDIPPSLLAVSATSFFIAREPAIHDHLATATEIFIPSTVLGELYFGAHKSQKVQDNISRIDEFALSNTILSCDMDTAKQYGDSKNRLKMKGRPIPENDIWIAALAQQYSLILASNDAHFGEIADLRTETWLA